MTEDENVKGNPELYAKMAEPYPNQEIANGALDGFMADLEELRKKWRIPEVMVIGMAHWTPPSGAAKPETAAADPAPMTIGRMLALGRSGWAPKLAALLFQRYAQPAIQLAKDVERTAAGEDSA